MTKELTQPEKDTLVYRTSALAVGAAAVMAVIKVYAWYNTGSIVMLAALLDSLVDGLMSVFIFLSVRLSQMPADANHRFGHGKAEAIAVFLQAIILVGAAGFLMWTASLTLDAPPPVQNIGLSLFATMSCILITLALVAVQSSVIKKTGSLALRADSIHYRADILLYVSGSAALLAAYWTKNFQLDGLFGIGVGFYILWQARSIFLDSVKQLMDEELTDETRAEIKKQVMQDPAVRGIHDLRTRRSGNREVIQFHIEMDGTMSLHQAHEIADRVEETLMAAFPSADIIIHQDPEGVEKFTPLEKT